MSEIDFENRVAAVDAQITGLLAQLNGLKEFTVQHGEWFPAPVVHGIAIVQGALAMRLRLPDLKDRAEVVAHHGRIWNATVRALTAIPTTWQLAPPALARKYTDLRWGMEPWMRRWSLQALPALNVLHLPHRGFDAYGRFG